MAEVHITKASGALRLLESSIRMLNAGEDRLAVFVVACAALSTLRELLRGRGISLVELLFRNALLEFAEKDLRGELEENIAQSALYPAIELIAKKMEEAGSMTVGDVHAPMDRNSERALFAVLGEPFNFLKHADRDPTSMMEETKFDEKLAIVTGISAYSMLYPGEELSELVRDFVLSHV